MRRSLVAALRDGFASGAVAPTTLYRWPASLPQALDQHERVLSTPDFARFAILDVRRRLIGTSLLAPGRFAGLELAIAIFAHEHRHHGVGTFAVRRLLGIAFEEMKARRVELGVYPSNAAAIAVYRRCGFVREALLRRYIYHDGAWRDLVWMSILRSEWKP